MHSLSHDKPEVWFTDENEERARAFSPPNGVELNPCKGREAASDAVRVLQDGVTDE
jgi:hypothetical protein